MGSIFLNGNTVLAVSETDLWERQRFTLAHELGHLVTGDRVIEAVGPDDPRSQREISVSEFARNFLVPLEDLRSLDSQHEDPWDGLRVAEVAWRYQVSPSVVAIQLKRAGLAPDSLINRACQMSANAWSSIGGWEPERQSLVATAATRRVPPSLVKRAVQAWRKKLIPTATIARLFDEDTQTIGRSLAEIGIEQDLGSLTDATPAR